MRSWLSAGLCIGMCVGMCLGMSLMPTAHVAAAPQAEPRAASAAAGSAAQRIVSLLPSLTETVCALDACERLVGTDSFSNWPASVRALPKLGGLDDLQVERVVALRPDLVLAAESLRAVERLKALGLRVVVLEPRSFADARQAIDRIAGLLGKPEAARPLWQGIEARLAARAAQVPAAWRGHSVYFEVAPDPYAASEASFIGELLARLGLRNIVGAELGPFPRLSPEWVVRRAPQLVMGTREAWRDMPTRPGWMAIPGVAQRQGCGFDATAFDALMRAGPRLPEAADAVVNCLRALKPGAPAAAPAPA